MKRILLFILFPFAFVAQTEFNLYRSSQNEHYWKNRKPHAAYWQQDVHYTIKASLDDKEDIVSGEEEIIYWNNSPKAINYVFFHLYSNAQTKDSYLANLYKNNNYKLKFGKYRKQGLGTTVDKISSNDAELKTELDNTVMKVWLNKPLQPGDSVSLKLNFKTYFDKEAIRNRMKMFPSGKYKHYDIVHWYPRISVYDAKFGWDTEQHMDHEFYGDFGSFHVELDLPSHYIGDGTGELINEDEVLPNDLKQKLQLSNFKSKPWGQAATEIIPNDGSRKTWKFSALNVHDVAYTFDPNYRLGEARWNGVRCIALVQEQHAIGWQYAPLYIAKIIETNSKNIGMYAYPKMIAADAQDGMEYPMLTLDGGYDPDFLSLFIHEMSHNWFFGMLGTNETYRAFMDEGFTQFYSSDTYENMVGLNVVEAQDKSAYVKRFKHQIKAREDEAFGGYYRSVVKGEEVTLNTHSDGFNGGIRHGGGYGQVYTKTATMLYNLEYVLGDSLFDAAIQNYFNQWKMCHPYPEDFRNSVIQFTGVDLNWFFDQWLETSKTIDYKIGRIKRKKGNNYSITFKREGRMQMPIDFTVVTKDGSSQSYHIPNNWFVKQTKSTVLPRWVGWDKVKKTYTAKIQLPARIQHIEIDTTHRLADVNYVNNAHKKKIHVAFDSKIYNAPDRTRYEMFARPSLWYNGYDGIKVGAHLNGNYLNYKNIFDATVWFNTGIGQVHLDSTAGINEHDMASFLVNYRTNIDKYMKKSWVYFSLRELDGLSAASFGLDKFSNNERNRFFVLFKGMLRDVKHDLHYLIYKNEWQLHKINTYASFGWEHNYSKGRNVGSTLFNLRAPMIFSDYDFSSIQFNWLNTLDAGKINFKTRLFAQYGHGYNVPYESALYVAGANPEELAENKYTRAMGAFEPFDFGKTTNHFAAGGGLNLRGYMGYLLVEKDANDAYRFNYKGQTGAAFNLEIEFGELFRFNPKFLKNTFNLKPYLFADAGVINSSYFNEYLKMTDPMLDAGAGFALTIQRWWKLQTIKPLTIRCDFPVFINRLPAAEKDYFQFRWMIGINRAF